MRLLIDGYNLLYKTNMPGIRSGSGWLSAARQRLIGTLLEQLTKSWQSETIVVFDAKDAPLQAAAIQHYGGLEVRFARDHAEADDLLEELIERELSPEKLLVVSSDHRLHRAARRRKAMICDSDNWYDRLLEGDYRAETRTDADFLSETSIHDPYDVSTSEIRKWLKLFGALPLPDESPDPAIVVKLQNKDDGVLPDDNSTQKAEKKSRNVAEPDLGKKPRNRSVTGKSRALRELGGNLENPFPEGYGEPPNCEPN